VADLLSLGTSMSGLADGTPETAHNFLGDNCLVCSPDFSFGLLHTHFSMDALLGHLNKILFGYTISHIHAILFQKYFLNFILNKFLNLLFSKYYFSKI
jgi:hypothetical protein